jgi:hypothetical protein
MGMSSAPSRILGVTRNAILGVLALAALLLTLGTWFRFGTEHRTVTVPAEPQAPTRSSPAPPELREALVETESGLDPDLPPEHPEEPEATYEAPSGPVVLLGDAIRVEADGLESVSEDGRFLLSWRRGAVHEKREVEVQGGSWTAEVPADVLLHVRDMTLGGVPISLETDEFPVPSDRHLSLRGSGLHSVLLHVVSSRSRELEGVEVWLADTISSGSGHHPGAAPKGEAILQGVDSPVLVPPRFDSLDIGTRYFVRAEGHAWEAIQLDHRMGGERTLVLPEAGALEVQLLGNADWLEPVVRLWPPDAGLHEAIAYAVRRPDADDRAVFESLAPGPYRVSVERGWASRRVSYGGANVIAVSGERLLVEIRVTPPNRPVETHLSGTLILPLAWEREGLKIVIAGEGQTESWMERRELPMLALGAVPALSADCEAFSFATELPMAGNYRLEVDPTTVRRLFRVPEEGLEGVEVRVPPPATAEVRVVDDASGDEIAVDSIFWSAPHVEGILSTPLHSAPANALSGRPFFRAPEGPIVLRMRDRSLLLVDEQARLELAPGHNELEVRVQRLIGVHFTFKDGNAEVPWDWSWRLSAIRDDGLRDRSRSIGILWFLEEGVYALRTEGIPGYRSIDGTVIDVVRDEGLIEVEVPLVRE